MSKSAGSGRARAAGAAMDRARGADAGMDPRRRREVYVRRNLKAIVGLAATVVGAVWLAVDLAMWRWA